MPQAPQGHIYNDERGEIRRRTDEAPGAEERSFQTRPGDVEPVRHSWGYDPDAVQAAIGQGVGLGQMEMDLRPAPRRLPPDPGEMSDEPDPARTDRGQHFR